MKHLRMQRLTIFMLWAVLALAISGGCEGCLVEERMALLQLKASFNPPIIASASLHENDTKISCCEWNWVECSQRARRVIKLTFWNVAYAPAQNGWYLNASTLLHLKSLRSLDLSSTNLSGWVQNESIEKLSSLRNLRYLNVSGNSVNRRFLSPLNQLSNLRVLKIPFNELTGSIDLHDFHGLNNLKELDLSHNKLNSITTYHDTKGIPSLTSLEFLDLSGSHFNNSIFSSLTRLQSLKALELPYNLLEGSTSLQGFCQLKNIEELNLMDNNFEGTIPSCFGNLSSLTYLDISGNNLRGNIALSPLKSLTSLEFLALSDNFFQIPVSFSTFANHSKLDAFIGADNDLVAESLSHNLALTFQPKVLVLKNCRLNKQLRPFLQFLYNQHNLRIINLSHISLGGTFLSWLLRNNTRLTYINLRNNSFIGPLDLPFHPNPSIWAIDFSHNHLQGPLPPNMSSLFPNLLFLNLSKNKFSGNIFLSFKKMNSLEKLDLSNNNLSGIMPQLDVDFPKLLSLRLSNNKFHGEISPEVLSQLGYLYLNGNNFTGELPMSISSNVLEVLDLSDNHFMGKLPSWIGNNVTFLEEISMSRNYFHGAIPTGFCYLSQLNFLDLSVNNLFGDLPSCFNLPNIEHVHLQRNSLQGQLTHAFWNSSSLVTLDLRENHFSGQIPNWIGNLSTLSVLLLKANHFSGEIPIQICYLRALSILDLSQNNFSGSIPSCLQGIPFKANGEIIQVPDSYLWTAPGEVKSYSKVVDFFEYQLDSMLSDELDYLFDVEEEVQFTTKWKSYSYKGDILNFMSGIDLSCNQLTGEIPIEIGDISTIHALNLSFNNVTGSIPTSFSNLKQLESLDLSHNNLNGRIPSQITKLNFLSVFSVAFNNLSGPTPDRKAQFGTFEEDSYEGNPFLCGPPLHNKCDETMSNAPTLDRLNGHDGEDTSFIDIDIFYVSFMVAYIISLLGISVVLYINPYWQKAWLYYVEIYATTFYHFVREHFPKVPCNSQISKILGSRS